MYKPGERPDDFVKTQGGEDNMPSNGKQKIEVDEDGFAITP